MDRAPLRELIKRTDERPEGTLLLKLAIKNSKNTVATYFFTPSIQEYFERVFEDVALGRAGGYWVQAEYGAGKTHFLSTLTSLLIDPSESLWSSLGKEEIKAYRRRLEGKKLFPVVLSLKGEADVTGRDNILSVIEEYTREVLDEKGLSGKVTITADDEIIEWYKGCSSDLQSSISSFIRSKLNQNLESLSDKSLAEAISKYCEENRIKPEITTSTRKRINHIYQQLIESGYSGILFVIDEFEAWQRRHPLDSPEYAQDEEVLETIGWILPKDMGLEVYTILASQAPAPAKLRGERFATFLLLADKNERDYDVIAAHRVRKLEKEKQPEIEKYYEYYYKEFKFLKNLPKEYFFSIFPFQPRCFEVIRRITARELPTVRLGISVMYDTISKEILNRDSLITVSDLMTSSELLAAFETSNYKDSYEAYLMSIKSLGDYAELDKEEKEIAERILKTLFLWHIAYIDTPRPLSIHDLTEATLTAGDIVKGEDAVQSIISKLRDLPQVDYKRDKNQVSFKVSKPGDSKPAQKFGELKRKFIDPIQIQKYWEEALILTPKETEGEESLFAGFSFDSRISKAVEYKKLEYPGEVILTQNWRDEYGERLKDNTHFRVVILTKSIEVEPKSIEDPRIAVCVPSELPESSKEAARDYWTLLKMEEAYKDKTESEADAVREWLKGKKREIVRNLLSKQIGVYKSGKVHTQRNLGIDESKIFSIPKTDSVLGHLVPIILADAYSSPPLDTSLLRKKFSSSDAKKVFEGFFKEGAGAAAKSACQNYASALGLSSVNQPDKFSPQSNNVFEFLKETLEESEGEIQVWKLYDDLWDVPYGLTRDLITLYILSFVAFGNPGADINLVPGNKLGLPGNKVTASNLRSLEWRAGFEKVFDTLCYSDVEPWDKVVSFARVLNPNLKAAVTADEIREQEMQLLQTLNDLNQQVSNVRESIEILSKSFQENIDEEELMVLDQLESVSRQTNYSEFYRFLSNEAHYENEYSLKEDFDKYKSLKGLVDRSAELLSIKSYLDNLTLPDTHKLRLDLLSLKGQLRLGPLLKNPEHISNLRKLLEQFKVQYQREYQIHHRDYYKEINKMRDDLEELKPRIEAVERLNKIPGLSATGDLGLSSHYKDLLSQISPCATENPVSVEAQPVCYKCSLTLDMIPPQEEVKDFVRRVDKTLDSKKRQLSQLLTKQILEEDKGNKLDKLLRTIQAAELDSFILNLTDEMVEYLKDLLNRANIVTEASRIFFRLADRFSFVDEENIEEVIKAFKEEVENALREAREKYKGKKVRISIK